MGANGSPLTTLLRDARFGLRLLGRNPGFTAVAVVTLALGISATTAIFSVVYGTFFAPLPYRQADRLVMVWEQQPGADRVPVSPGNFVDWRREATVFSELNAWGGRSVNLATADRPENLVAGVATPGFLAMLGYGHRSAPHIPSGRGSNAPAALIRNTRNISVPMTTLHARCGRRYQVVSSAEKANVCNTVSGNPCRCAPNGIFV